LKSEPNIVPSASDFVAHMQELARAASASIEQRSKATAANQNAKRRDYEFGVGDKVLLSTKHFKPSEDKEGRKTLAAKFAGPYEMIQVVSPVAYKLALRLDPALLKLSSRTCKDEYCFGFIKCYSAEVGERLYTT
jgi:hypothetical protein